MAEYEISRSGGLRQEIIDAEMAEVQADVAEQRQAWGIDQEGFGSSVSDLDDEERYKVAVEGEVNNG